MSMSIKEAKELVSIEGGGTYCTSKEIADKFNKEHKHVMRDIEKLHCSDRFRESNFGLSSYISLQNKTLKCYSITRDGFAFLAMGFTGPEAGLWKEKYITAFNTMEKVLLNDVVTPSMDFLAKAYSIKHNNDSKASAAGRVLNNHKTVKVLDRKMVDDAKAKVQLALNF